MKQPAANTDARRPRQRDPLFSLLIDNGIWGAALGALFVAGVLTLDLGRIRSLAFAAPDGLIALALLTLGSIVTFASVAMGGAIMMVPRQKPDETSGGKGEPAATGTPAEVPLRVSGFRH